MSDLPPGFVLDQPADAGLPSGFVLDKPGVAEDVAKSAGAGLANAAAGTIGAVGDARSLLGSAVDYAGSKLGFDPSTVKNVANAATYALPGGRLLANAPTSQDVLNTVKNNDPSNLAFYDPKTLAGSYTKTGAEFLPGMLAGGEGGLGARFARNVALPAIGSETAGQITKGTAAEPYARLAGALLSPGIETAARRAVTPLPASAERQALAETLRNEGVPLTAGQSSGSRPLQWMESALGDTPGSGGAAARVMENQAENFTAAALRRAGIDANRATPEVIDNAFARIGGDIEGVGRRNNVLPTAAFNNELGRVERNYNNLVSASNRAPVVANTIDDLRGMIAAGRIDGPQFNAITSRLATQARGSTNDPHLQAALQGIRTALDNAMERSLFRTGNQQDMQILRNARREYRNLLVLERAATGAGSGAAEGLISPSQLRNAVVQQNRRAYARGNGDFADLARAGEALLKPLPQSGTSPRHNVTHMLQTIGAIVGGSSGAAGGPGGAAAGALAGLAAPAVAGRALLSRPVQAYLGNQVLAAQPRGQIANRALSNALLASAAFRPLMLPGP
jgi:hypothetical protein